MSEMKKYVVGATFALLAIVGIQSLQAMSSAVDEQPVASVLDEECDKECDKECDNEGDEEGCEDEACDDEKCDKE